MKRLLAFGLIGLLITALAACSQEVEATAWTEAELQGVFDLSELGNDLTVEGDRLVLGGKVLPADVLADMQHLNMGKDQNLLNFSYEALTEMSNEAAYRLKHASPEQLREFMGTYGVSMDAVQAAWADDQTISASEIKAVAADLDAGLSAAGGTANGAALLRDLGLND